MAEMKIAIAEDNRQALDMLGNILESDKEIQVVGKAENGTDAYNMIVKTKPDIVFLDVVMPGMDGISVMERIKTNQDCSAGHFLCYDYSCEQRESDCGCFSDGRLLLHSKAIFEGGGLRQGASPEELQEPRFDPGGQPEGGTVYGVGGV